MKTKATPKMQTMIKLLFDKLGEEIRTESQYQKRLEYEKVQIEMLMTDYDERKMKPMHRRWKWNVELMPWIIG